MIYDLLKPIIKLSLLVFFRKIDVIGEENVPKSGPILFVANHPSALMDPLMAAITVKRKLHFLAGSNWFGKRFQSYFFKNHFNMIPVYRPWLAKEGEEVSNADMFDECYKSMAKGKSVIIFPEASSVTVSKIRALKTGAIRIQSGFEDYMNGKTSVPIIPIGISYSNAHKFQSRVVVHIGKPVTFTGDYSDMDSVEAVRGKTEEMQEAMKASIIHIENDDNQNLVKNVNRLFIDTYRKEDAVSHKDIQANFEYAQNVAKAVQYFEQADRKGYQNMSERVSNYFKALRHLDISDDTIGDSSKLRPSLSRMLLLILGFPFALLSLIVFFIPFQLTKALFTRKFKPIMGPMEDQGTLNEAFKSTLIVASGAVIFMLWNVVLFVSTGVFTGNWWLALGVLFIGYPLFRFGLYYAKIGLYVMRYFKGKKLRNKENNRIEQLVKERQEIIEVLKAYRVRYDAAINDLEVV